MAAVPVVVRVSILKTAVLLWLIVRSLRRKSFIGDRRLFSDRNPGGFIEERFEKSAETEFGVGEMCTHVCGLKYPGWLGGERGERQTKRCTWHPALAVCLSLCGLLIQNSSDFA